MGSPYFVHRQANRVHVIKTAVGLSRVLDIVLKTMYPHRMTTAIDSVDDGCPEWVVLRDILKAYRASFHTNSREVIFLEARYEWTGWEKFQRVIIIDNSRDTLIGLDDSTIYHFKLDERY